MKSNWRCQRCHAHNGVEESHCENCGQSKEASRTRETSHEPKTIFCEVDGGLIDPRGFCGKGNAYVLAAACPFVCPLCRHPLTWQGRCFACFGTNSGERASWTIPGDRYEPSNGHWVQVERGQRVLSYEESHQALSMVRQILDGELSAGDGAGLLEVLLG